MESCSLQSICWLFFSLLFHKYKCYSIAKNSQKSKKLSKSRVDSYSTKYVQKNESKVDPKWSFAVWQTSNFTCCKTLLGVTQNTRTKKPNTEQRKFFCKWISAQHMKHLRSNPYNLNVSVITSSFMIDKNSLYFSCVSQNYREHFLFPTDSSTLLTREDWCVLLRCIIQRPLRTWERKLNKAERLQRRGKKDVQEKMFLFLKSQQVHNTWLLRELIIPQELFVLVCFQYSYAFFLDEIHLVRHNWELWLASQY